MSVGHTTMQIAVIMYKTMSFKTLDYKNLTWAGV